MSLRILFVVQGEGRGHMTQALALAPILRKAGHEVVATLVGRSHRGIPPFFSEKIGSPIHEFDSPTFVMDKGQRSVMLGPTIRQNLKLIPNLRESFDLFDRIIEQEKPDVIVSFFEVMAGLYNHFREPRIPMVAVGHQYMFHHPAYPFPRDSTSDRMGARTFVSLSALGAARRLALSFYPAPAHGEQNIRVVPPLLRPELFDQPTDVEEDFILIYLLNSGYAADVKRWHAANPDIRLECFWDRKNVEAVEQYTDNLTFHTLHDTKFLSMMARCRGLVCTAGFESISEALYLNKPVLAVPVEGHFEQYCNALDAVAYGAGTWNKTFDLSHLISYLPKHRSTASNVFKSWLEAAEEIFLEEIEAAADGPLPSRKRRLLRHLRARRKKRSARTMALTASKREKA